MPESARIRGYNINAFSHLASYSQGRFDTHLFLPCCAVLECGAWFHKTKPGPYGRTSLSVAGTAPGSTPGSSCKI